MMLTANVRASGYMMLSMMGFTVNDSLIKSLDGEIGTFQIMAVRGLILSILIGVIIWHRGLLPKLRLVWTPLIWFRSAMELMATVLFLSALTQLPFANISAILQSLPLAVTVGAALFFGEVVGWRRWSAIAVGFAGVLLVIRPGLDGFDTASLLVVVSVLFAAARDLATRALPVILPSLLVSGFTSALVAVFGAVASTATGSWVAVSVAQLQVLALAAGFLFFGYQFIVLAMRTGDVAHVVPFRYTSLLWAIGLGYLWFDEAPDALTLLGSGIIVSMGCYTLYREHQHNRRQSIINKENRT